MLDEKLVILGAIISFIGNCSYLIATIKGKAQPNRVSWFLWSLAPFIAFFAEIKQGIGFQSLTTFMIGFNPLIIFCASFLYKGSTWQIRRFDIICGAFSVIGLILWYITRVGDIAIIFSILADGAAALPTVVKSYTAPETEDYKAYLTTALSSLITLFTIKAWNLAYAGIPIYIVILDTLLVCFIVYKPGQRLKLHLSSNKK
jgi:hypothetical protein